MISTMHKASRIVNDVVFMAVEITVMNLLVSLVLILEAVCTAVTADSDGCGEGQYYDSVTRSCAPCMDICENAFLKKTDKECKSKCGIGYLTQSSSLISTTPTPEPDNSKNTIIAVIAIILAVAIFLIICILVYQKRKAIRERWPACYNAINKLCGPEDTVAGTEQPTDTQDPLLTNGELPQDTHIHIQPNGELPLDTHIHIQPNGELPQDTHIHIQPNGELPQDTHNHFQPNGELPQDTHNHFQPNGELPQDTHIHIQPNGELPQDTHIHIQPNGELPQDMHASVPTLTNGEQAQDLHSPFQIVPSGVDMNQLLAQQQESDKANQSSQSTADVTSGIPNQADETQMKQLKGL